MVGKTTTHQTVLVVEDDGVVRLDAVETLRDAGFEVIEADGAEQALEVVAARDDIDLLFTDINMPGRIDGVELARRVHRRHPAILLLLTSGETRLKPSQIPDSGAFIAKPYSPQTVTRTVARMLA
ncbi:MAG TPA: response regulator [Caulobacteraceae bacterium]